VEAWRAVSTTYEKHVQSVNNSWGGDEATAFLTHLAAERRYRGMARRMAFVHGHVASWHVPGRTVGHLVGGDTYNLFNAAGRYLFCFCIFGQNTVW
jgi:hypothetical protein